jgi:hypothetical protein
LKPNVVRDLNIELAILKSGIANIYWTYQNTSGTVAPFEVPFDIVSINRADIMAEAVLSDYFDVSTDM